MSRKLEASLKKIDKVFDKCYEKGINPNQKDKGWSERTRDVYAGMMKSFAREYHREFGTADITKMTDENKIEQLIQTRIDRFHDGKTEESYNLKTLAASIKAFNHGVANTNVFKRSFTVGNPDDIRATMREQHVIRSSKTSQVMHARPEHCESVLENIKNSGYDVKTRQIAYAVGKISMLTGGRISSILKLTTDDIVIDKSKNEIQFVKDKGGLTRTVRIDRETAQYLDRLRDGKGKGQRLFSTIRVKGEGKGTFKPIEEMRKEVSRIISQAGKHLETTKEVTIRDKDGKLKTITVKQNFTPHSFRKSFALTRTAYYLEKFNSKSAIDRYVSRRIGENEKLKEKLDTVRERINKDRKVDRDLHPHEYAIFFTSVDLGHFRNDVITQFYTTYKEVADYLEEKR